jgi:hypothetical protein
VSLVGRYLERDTRTLHSNNLPAFRKQSCYLSGKPASLASKNGWQDFRLTLIGTVVNEEPGCSFHLSRPKVTIPPYNSDKAKIVEVYVPVVPTLDMPEHDCLTEAIVRGLSESTWTRDGTAAVVEPISGDVPLWHLIHKGLRLSRPVTFKLENVEPQRNGILDSQETRISRHSPDEHRFRSAS